MLICMYICTNTYSDLNGVYPCSPAGVQSGASLQGTSWGWVIQLSLSTRDKLGLGYTVEPLYKGQVGVGLHS